MRVTVGTINNYLAGIRSKHIECDLPWVNRSDMPRLQRHLNGFEWMEKATKDGHLRLPLTHKILVNVVETKWNFEEEDRRSSIRRALDLFDGPSSHGSSGLFNGERPLHAPRGSLGAEHEQGRSHRAPAS